MSGGGKVGRFTGFGCGCAGALFFLAVIGLPVLFAFSFGMSPCEDGPCDPDGARDFGIVFALLLAAALLIFLGIRYVVRRRPGTRA